MNKSVIYFDHNANTLPNQDTLNTLLEWSLKGNPSSVYPSAESCKNLLDNFKYEISKQFSFDINLFTILFTSGASESNSQILTTCCRAFIRAKQIVPHIITSNVEHDSIMELCKTVEDVDKYKCHRLRVGTTDKYFGMIDPTELSNAIRPNTCIISVMMANNETGVINNIKNLAYIAHTKNIPFHTDAVQYIPRGDFNVTELGIDSFSLSFHKLGGPIGCGILVIKNSLIEGYGLPPHIYGTQQLNLRGGTIPIAQIAASRTAFLQHFNNRSIKNINLVSLKRYFLERLTNTFPCMYISHYKRLQDKSMLQPITVVLITSPEVNTLSNTVLLSICKKNICNIKIRKLLSDNGIMVSIGSACKTGGVFASHVLKAYDVPCELYPGIIRISFGDTNTSNEIDIMLEYMSNIITSNMADK